MITTRLATELSAVGLAAALTGGCTVDALQSDATGTFERTLQLGGPVDLTVRTGSGNIQVRTGNDHTVHVVGHVRARTGGWLVGDPAAEVKRLLANPPIQQTGDTLHIGIEPGATTGRGVSISYELTVPSDTRLHSRTGSGDQVIGDLRGPLDAQAGSGAIRAGRIGGPVTLSTGSGDIDLLGSAGRLEATAGSGTIHAAGVAGPIRARTGSGRVDLAQTGLGEVDVATGSGDVVVAGAQGALRLRAGSGDISIDGRPAADWQIRTGSGSVDVRVPRSASFALDAVSGSGSIDVAHPIQQVEARSRRRLQGAVGGGGPRLDLATSSGRIRLE